MKKIVTKASLVRMLNDANEAKKAQIIGRALVVLFQRQTEDEQIVNETHHRNWRGFNSGDAKQGSIGAKTFLKRGNLMDFQVEYWLKKGSKGTPRIVKYHRQLNEAALAKAKA